ncbi:MAG: HEAT repeat domain-containing protein [Sandaracinaceae bacterium]|nr:HEAT repeat domain-containing protein [Sandaracinaceae bacterium]
MSLAEHLNAIFEADRRAREAEAAMLAEGEPDALAALLEQATGEALGLEDEEEAELRLVRLADLCAQVPGPKMADALVAILDHPSPRVRVEAGEALRDVAYERFKEVARAVERAIAREHRGLAMQELPFVLAEVRDPDPVPLIARFLKHPDGDVVAAAIEALVDYGDPSAAPHIAPLVGDRREALLEELDETPVSVGELAEEALAELGAESGDAP